MCGIAGVVRFDGYAIASEEIAAMSAALRHRGPDGEGTYFTDGVALAHRRLAIIDPRGGHQPFLSEDERIALTYNGEIYNYVELRGELSRERPFATTSDTEVLLRAYEKHGIGCLERFRGMFAFALYDSSERALFVVRDRVGIKPLYYCRFGERFAFASELRALLRLPWVEREIAHESSAQYLRYGYVPTPATIYSGVYKLEAGHYLRIATGTGRITKHAYWNLAVRAAERAESICLEELNAILDDTVRIYVRSDVPFGCFLSGGVDSSLVTAVMSRHLPTPVETFSIGFGESEHSELPYAAEASRVLGTHHHEKIVSPELATDLLARMVRHFGEPFADSSAIPTYYVSQQAASHVKMVLSGDGGDELFAGYDSYALAFRDLSDPLHFGKRLVYRPLARLMPAAGIGRSAAFRSLSAREKQDSQRHIFGSEALARILPTGCVPRPVQAAYIGTDDLDPITRFQAEDFKTYLPDDVLTKVDRMSMAHSLEVRVPLLDHAVVEFAFSLPLALKIRKQREPSGPVTKLLLKRSAARFFPDSFLGRPKRGFGIPLVEWCTGPLRPLIEERLLGTTQPVFAEIRKDEVSRLVKSVLDGRPENVARVWSLLMLALWLTEVHECRESP